MAIRDLIIPNDERAWNQFALALYATKGGDAFPVGTVVIEDRVSSAALLISDGTGQNALALSNAQVDNLLTNGKPAGYNAQNKTLPANSPIYVYLNARIRSIIQAGKSARDAYQNSLANPLTPVV